ncbi:recombinase family protein [Streptomyces sp. GD-15H]|uniref:recombinase family protein n=1 Tax=Streptomyces sp. GD-15H TaxID=3129112 RepID=UPI0032504791
MKAGLLTPEEAAEEECKGVLFGRLEDNPRKLDPKNSRIRKKTVEKRIAGDKAATVMKRLAAENTINTATGKHFTRGGTEAMILAPRNRGIRTHDEEIAYVDDDEIVMGHWDPILDSPDTWYPVQAKKVALAGSTRPESVFFAP